MTKVGQKTRRMFSLGAVLVLSFVVPVSAQAKDKEVGQVTIQEKIDCRIAWMSPKNQWTIWENGGSYFWDTSKPESIAAVEFWEAVLVSDLGSLKKADKRSRKSNYSQDLKGLGDAITVPFTSGMLKDCRGLQRIVETERDLSVTYPHGLSAGETLELMDSEKEISAEFTGDMAKNAQGHLCSLYFETVLKTQDVSSGELYDSIASERDYWRKDNASLSSDLKAAIEAKLPVKTKFYRAGGVDLGKVGTCIRERESRG